MLRDEPSTNSLHAPASDWPAVAVLCGLPALEASVTHMLEAAGFRREIGASILVLLDTPHGFALHQLQHVNQTETCVIVVTSNLCPEYWEDLWDCQVAGLLVGPAHDLSDAIMRVAAGERYRNTPPHRSPLTAAERRLLHLLGHGQSNQQIADHLCVQCQTVRNTLATIYHKLCVKNRSEALLYYWGILHTRACGHL